MKDQAGGSGSVKLSNDTLNQMPEGEQLIVGLNFGQATNLQHMLGNERANAAEESLLVVGDQR